jgi:DNA (cytosine-5)-methyltransferase 1
MKAVSLFSGCGGFDQGVQNCGVEFAFANDIDAVAEKFYKAYFPKVYFKLGNIQTITEFPEADILIGCYPCTGFSAAARRRWKNRQESRDLTQNDTNFLFREFLRAINIVNPKAIFIENVRGMLSANNGFFLQEQIAGFKSLGFSNIKPLVLDASDYGVPQTRVRVFFAALHDDFGKIEFDLPLPSNGTLLDPKRTLADAISDLDPWPIGEFYEGVFHGHYLTRNRKRKWDMPSYTVVADGHHVPLHPSGNPMLYVGKDKWKLGEGPNRRLSWRECLRIQGLPDIDDIDDSLMNKYKVAGNSVPPKLAEAVARPVIEKLRTLL